MAVGNLVKRIQQKMRQDAGVNGDAQRIEQMVWMFFLKVYDTQEYDWEDDAIDHGEVYKSIIPEDLRWRNWAPSKDENGKAKGDALTGQGLLDFINDVLFPVLQGRDSKDGKYKGIRINKDSSRHEAIVQEVFQEVNQYMKNGQRLRDVIDIIDEVDLLDVEESHAFGDIYESILRDLQSASNAGEFYTPRPVTDFVIEKIDPRLGELMGDLASGTGGFVISALKHMEKQRKTPDDEMLFQKSVMAQEWKPFPYLLGVTNIILHGIKDPMMFHMDSLSHPMSDYQEDGKLNTIAMNPPFGGATDAATIKNFKQEYRSSETADLFMVLIMQRLAENGRAGVVLPDGFLFGTDGPKFAIKKRLLTDFNLHTIVRLPASVFAPYTGIATNILFFNNAPAAEAPEGFATKETWFYRLDMPKGYKYFNKTNPIKSEHFNPIRDWWGNRIELDNGAKSRVFTPQELIDLQCNFDQCKYPKEDEDILTPKEVMASYLDRSEECYRQIRNSFSNLLNNLQGNNNRIDYKKSIANPWKELADISASLPDRLRKSILQEAIKGNLVAQDSLEEPASVLIEHIHEEKEKLELDGSIKKRDIFNIPIEEENYPYILPETWEWVRLQDITTYISRGKSPVYSETKKYPVVAQKCNQWSGFSLEKAKFADPQTVDKYAEERLLQDGDLLWNSTGIGTLGRMAIYDSSVNEYGWAVADSHVTVIRTRPDFAYYKYLYYYFASPEVQSVIEDKSDGSTKQKELSQDTVKMYEVPLPPLSEQHRIVEKIEALFAEIENMTLNNNNETDKEETETD